MTVPHPDSGAGAGGVAVLLLGDAASTGVGALLARAGLALVAVADQQPIPFSHWGDPEAGIEQQRVYARADTPLHSVLHEACHVLCMDGARRAALERDANGDYDEENAVCCLQILLAAELPGVGSARLMDDMDRWGYTFRLGSARRWFESDAGDAKRWLAGHGLIDGAGRPTLRARA